MSEKHYMENPPDLYGRVYIELLESPLSAHAKLCYGVMWSFGLKGCWASLAAIARRMSVSKPTVTKCQEELLAAGWVVLLEDNKGGKAKKWAMKNTLKLVVEDGNDKPALSLTTNPVDPKKEEKQELNLNIAPSAPVKSATQPKVKTPCPYMAIIEAEWLKAGLLLTQATGFLRMRVAKAGQLVGEDVFRLVVKDYLGLPSPKGHSVGGFVFSFDGLGNRRMAEKRRESDQANAYLQRLMKGR